MQSHLGCPREKVCGTILDICRHSCDFVQQLGTWKKFERDYLRNVGNYLAYHSSFLSIMDLTIM